MNPMAQASDRLDEAIAEMTRRLAELDKMAAERDMLRKHLNIAVKAREVLTDVYPYPAMAAEEAR